MEHISQQCSEGLRNMLLAFGGEHSRLRPKEYEMSDPESRMYRSDPIDPQENYRKAMRAFERSKYNPENVEVMQPSFSGASSFVPNVQPVVYPQVQPQPQPVQQIPVTQPMPVQVPVQPQPVYYQAPPPQQIMPSNPLDISQYLGEPVVQNTAPSNDSPLYIDFSRAITPVSQQLEKSLHIQGRSLSHLDKILTVLCMLAEVDKTTLKPIAKAHPVAKVQPTASVAPAPRTQVNIPITPPTPQREIPIPESGEFPMDESLVDNPDFDPEAILGMMSPQEEEWNPEDDEEEAPAAPAPAPAPVAKPAKARVTAKAKKPAATTSRVQVRKK